MKNSKKGFTIVELVIVIAVIAILAAVLIPTFSSITQSAKESAAMQQAKSGLNAVLALTGGTMPDGTVFAVTDDNDAQADYWFEYSNNKLQMTDIGTHTKQLNGNFCVYVSSKAITKEAVGGVNKLKKDTAVMIATALGAGAVAGDVTLTGGGDCYTAVIGADGTAKTVNVYYTADIEETMVILLGGEAAAVATTAAPVATEAPAQG